MPFYVYEFIRKDEKTGKRCEIMQKMSAKPLKKHPETGESIRRVFVALSTPGLKYDNAVKGLKRKDRKFEPPPDAMHRQVTPKSI